MSDIVVVDSSDDVLRLLELVFNTQGWSVKTVNTSGLEQPGACLSEVIKGEHARVVVFDVPLPYDRALEMAVRARTCCDPHVGWVLLTTDAQLATRIPCPNCPILLKPFEPPEAIAAVRAVWPRDTRSE